MATIVTRMFGLMLECITSSFEVPRSGKSVLLQFFYINSPS